MDATPPAPGPEPSTGSQAPRCFAWTLAAGLPFAAMLALTLRYGVDVPVADEWSLAPGIVRACEGATTFEDVWLPAGEHVAIFPRLVMLGLAPATHWNLRAQMLVSLAFALAALPFLGLLLARAGMPPWSLALAACFVFSFHSHETFLWAYQIHLAMAFFGAVGALTLLGADRLRPVVFVAAIALAWIASWSLLNGYLAWPVGAFVLALRRYERPATRLGLLAIWLGAGGALVAVALLAIHPRAPESTAPAPVLLEFAARWIGTGLLGPPASGEAVRAAGWAGLVLAVAAALAALRRRGTPAVLALVALAGFGLASAAMTAAGRAALGGVTAAQASRYTTFSGLIWVVVALLPAIVAGGRTRAARVAQVLVAGAVVAVLIVTAARDVSAVRALSERRQAAATAFRTGEGITWEAVETVFSTPDELIPVLAERLAMLRRLRLSLFRDASPSEVVPPPWTGSLTTRLSWRTNEGREAGTVEISGGVPGNLAFVLFVAGSTAKPDGPFAFDPHGCATRTFEAASIPKGARYHVLSLDRSGRVINTEPAPVAR